MSVGYYIISGWLKEKDAKGFDAKPEENIHTGVYRESIRTFFSMHCHECDDPRLIKVTYYYADRKPRNVSWELSPKKFKKFFKDPSKS